MFFFFTPPALMATTAHTYDADSGRHHQSTTSTHDHRRDDDSHMGITNDHQHERVELVFGTRLLLTSPVFIYAVHQYHVYMRVYCSCTTICTRELQVKVGTSEAKVCMSGNAS